MTFRDTSAFTTLDGENMGKREDFDKWADTTPMNARFKGIAWMGYQARQPEIDAITTALIAEQTENLDLLKEASTLNERIEAKQGVIDTLRKKNAALKAENERLRADAERRTLSVAEQIAQAKEDNADLVHWECYDPQAWDEAMRQDEILRATSKWRDSPFADRFAEVVRRTREILPEASTPP